MADVMVEAPPSVLVERCSDSGELLGVVRLDPEYFGALVNVPLLHQVVKAQLAAKRSGTHSTKTRAEFQVAVPSLIARRAPAVPGRAPRVRRSSQAEASPLAPSLVTIAEHASQDGPPGPAVGPFGPGDRRSCLPRRPLVL